MQMTNDEIWAELSKVYNLPNLPEEATEIIGDLMLKLGDDWIPCSERLPDGPQTCIVTGRQKYAFEKEWDYFVDVADSEGSYIDGYWDTFNDWDEGQETHIIAWMPLPEPYKP